MVPMTSLLNAAMEQCDLCTTYASLCACFDAHVRPLLERCFRTPLSRPVSDALSPDVCAPSTAALRDALSSAGDDVWLFLRRAAASVLDGMEKRPPKRPRDVPSASASASSALSVAAVHVFVLFHRRPPPALDGVRLSWPFLRHEGARAESAASHLHAKAAERRRALLTSVLAVFSERAQRHFFSAVWTRCLRHASDALHLHVLHRAADFLLPHLTNPLVVADYMSGCFAGGGLLAVLALRGIFVLMLDHGLEYPQYYAQLYTLLSADAFASRHRADLFRLLDLSMASARVPAYVAAAFVKRTARTALLAPTPALYFALPFMRRVLQRHPNSLALIHRGTGGGEMGEGRDPFQPNASMEECRAMESTLWELTALERHYAPAVPLMVAAFASSAEDTAPLRYEKTYARLFTAEVTRKGTEGHIPTVAYEEPQDNREGDALLLV